MKKFYWKTTLFKVDIVYSDYTDIACIEDSGIPVNAEYEGYETADAAFEDGLANLQEYEPIPDCAYSLEVYTIPDVSGGIAIGEPIGNNAAYVPGYMAILYIDGTLKIYRDGVMTSENIKDVIH